MYVVDGVLPDEVTYSAVLDVYVQLDMKEEVLAPKDATTKGARAGDPREPRPVPTERAKRWSMSLGWYERRSAGPEGKVLERLKCRSLASPRELLGDSAAAERRGSRGGAWKVGIHGEASVGGVKDKEEEDKRRQGSPVCHGQMKEDEEVKRWKKTREEDKGRNAQSGKTTKR